MRTIVETSTFVKMAATYWDEDERLEFISWLAAVPDAGAVVPGSGGVRKVRWSRSGTGKRGGVRVVYFNTSGSGETWLLLLYAKGTQENIASHVLRSIREQIER